jgi:hypothetical protein
MKYLIIILICLCSCKATETIKKPIAFKDDLNKSIVDGFYNNDTTGISKNIYFLR